MAGKARSRYFWTRVEGNPLKQVLVVYMCRAAGHAVPGAVNLDISLSPGEIPDRNGNQEKDCKQAELPFIVRALHVHT
jgi:hypothetical protein